jgi:multicomponent Na+:H+ antiporter subunit E
MTRFSGARDDRLQKLKVMLASLLFFAAIWLVLTSGNLDQWPLALIFVLAATAASVRLWPERSGRSRLVGVVRFAGYFLLQSTLGGWDVARRALQPSMPLDPGFVEHPFKLQLEEARVFFAWTVSLLPGTASASVVSLKSKSLNFERSMENP